MQQITSIPKLPARQLDSHKGTFGKVCIIAGSKGMAGAPALAATAALRSGAGLVRIATPESILPTVAAFNPCYTTIALPQNKQGQISEKAIPALLNIANENDILAFGPGIGTSKDVKTCLQKLLEHNTKPITIDADGLNCLATIKHWHKLSAAPITLTPHPGEMKTLWQKTFRTPQPKDRIKQATELAKHTNTTVILKGHNTIVANAENFYINTTGNPGMATAGAGDTLTGIIAALAAQGLTPFDAAILAVYTHGQAADIATKQIPQISLIATDITNHLPQAFKTQQ